MIETGNTLIVPIFNMARELDRFATSLSNSSALEFFDEVILINDGSTDDTSLVAKQLKSKHPKIRSIDLPRNTGRFLARLEGARAARYSQLIFSDARVEITPNLIIQLPDTIKKYPFCCCTIEIPIGESIFNLYWERLHQFLYPVSYQKSSNSVQLTVENFDQILKGTTFCSFPKLAYLDAAEKLAKNEVLNDDTHLFQSLVRSHSVWIRAEMKIRWVPRNKFAPFVERIWERGESFVEYHVFTKMTRFGLAMCTAIIIALGCLLIPELHSWLFLLAMITGVSTGLLIGHSWSERLRILPLHLCVGVTCIGAVANGLIRQSYKKLVSHRGKKTS